MREPKGCSDRMTTLYRLIPSYPKEVTTKELAQKMNTTAGDIAMLIEHFRSIDPICEDEGRICYSSPKDRKRFLNMINKREKKNEQIMQ